MPIRTAKLINMPSLGLRRVQTRLVWTRQEDIQHGFTWRGVTVVNPYQIPCHPLLSPLLL